MNVFLMHPDRDFKVEYIEQRFKRVRPISATEATLIQDLELNTLWNVMAKKDEFLFDVAQQAIFSSLDSPDAIRYRQEILKDCLRYPEIVRQMYRIPLQAIENKHKHWMGIFTSNPSAVLSSALDMLGMFVSLLKMLRQIADENIGQFESRGFQRFFSMIQQELSDEYFSVVEDHLKELSFRGGILLSAELGPGNEAKNYLLRMTNHTGEPWVKRVFARKSPIYAFYLHPRDDAGARALGELRDRGVNLVANAVAQSSDHIDSFFTTLRLELAFYMGCLNLSETLAGLGVPITFPDPVPANERRLSFTDMYDISLALTMNQKVVGNDVMADGKDLTMITGANQGGKSTFLRSVGLAQLMMQCGMFVPAESFSANLCNGLFTHYKREEDTSMKSGKFDEELSRMSVIVDQIKPNAMILFNESFAATNEREGSEIASQIVRALLEKRVKVFYVTHLYTLAHRFHSSGMQNAIFLRADRKEDGERTFKLIEGQPLKTSFGEDLYQKIFQGEHE